MVAAVKSPPASRRNPSTPVITIHSSFVEWCQEKGYDLNVERMKSWQQQFRAERDSSSKPFYSTYTAEALRAKEESVLKQLTRIKAAQAAKR